MSKRISNVFEGRDVVSIKDFTTDEINYFLRKAEEFKQHRDKLPDLSKAGTGGRRLKMAYAFFENSTRTRLSSVEASENLGMHRFGFGGSEGTSLQKGESAHHTLQMFVGYGADVIVMRHNSDGSARYIADLFDIPVINGGDGKHEHPTQAMLDLFTIDETQGRLSGLEVALVGDLKNGRTVHSLIKALRAFGNNRFYLVSPPGLEMPPEYTKGFDDVVTGMSLDEALRKTDVAYVTRIQLERIDDEAEKKRMVGSMQLKASMLTDVRKNLRILHPLPINADYPEIETGLHDRSSPHAYFFGQAENGVYMREVLLASVLGHLGNDFDGQLFVPREYSDSAKSIPIPVGKSSKPEGRERIIGIIKNGVVIDHIPPGLTEDLVRQFRLRELGKPQFVGDYVPPDKTTGKVKGIMKIVDHSLTPQQLITLALYCPSATISDIKDGKIVSKTRTELPDRLIGLLDCSNSRCISNNPREIAPKMFYTLSRDPAVVSCHYCDTSHSVERGNVRPK